MQSYGPLPTIIFTLFSPTKVMFMASSSSLIGREAPMIISATRTIWGDPTTAGGGERDPDGGRRTPQSVLCQVGDSQRLCHPFHALDPDQLGGHGGG